MTDSNRRRPERHIRHLKSGKASLINENVVYGDPSDGGASDATIRKATSSLAAGDGVSVGFAGLASKYQRFPQLKDFDDASSPYILVGDAPEASWTGSMYILPLNNTGSWGAVLGAHREGGTDA
jgi:hypothetical protein